MRLWSIHPCYLDARGLVALWREGLLAQKVLLGKTRGYRKHPQLERFKEALHPGAAISRYLLVIYAEASRRGYHFSKHKINPCPRRVSQIKVPRGQLTFEFRHLLKKLKKRDHDRYLKLLPIREIKAHPSFLISKGPIAQWEKFIDK